MRTTNRGKPGEARYKPAPANTVTTPKWANTALKRAKADIEVAIKEAQREADARCIGAGKRYR